MINILIITLVTLTAVSVTNTQRYRKKHESDTYTQFLSKDWTNNARGLAILMIMLAHIVTDNPTVSIIGGGITHRVISGFGGFGVGVFFFLSGFGNYFSVPEQKRAKWLLRRFGKLILGFVICFFLVTAVQFIFGQGSCEEAFQNLITLKMPNTSTWYLKTQLLFYLLILAASFAPEKYRTAGLSVFVLGYAVVMRTMGFQDFWWKTSMCFPAGFLTANYCDKIHGWLQGKRQLILPVLAVISYGFILVDSRYLFFPQLFAFVLLSSAFVFMGRFSRLSFFGIVGKLSYEIYLVHIGLLKIIYGSIRNADAATLAYIGLVVLLALTANHCGRRILKTK